MKDIHFVAFCKLLGLPFAEHFDQYTWDLAKFTCFITRKRNFFRNMADVEPITDLDSWHSEDSGPLLTISGKTVAFAPLLRTRKTMNYGICHSSWTLYQPHALVWDYWTIPFGVARRPFGTIVIFRQDIGLLSHGSALSPHHFLMIGGHSLKRYSGVVAPQLISTRLSLRCCLCLSAVPSDSPSGS